MNIEYLPGIKPGDKIDLSQFDRPKKDLNPDKYLSQLKDRLSLLAQESNQSFPGFLNNEGRIILAGPEAQGDEALVRAQEDGFSQGVHKSLEEWHRTTERNPANLTEMALTVMLHKFLKEKFIVARSSTYDDYNNGVDQVLVYKETGEVVCGFDEVIGNNGDDGGLKKAAKLERLMARGGARIKYGAKKVGTELVRGEVREIPAFYMSLSKAELAELLESLSSSSERISAPEEKLFEKLINSLETQTLNQNLNQTLKAKTEEAISRLRESLSQKRAA